MTQLQEPTEIKKHNLGRLQINRFCNQRCVFCSAPPVGGELAFEEVQKRMTRLKEEGTTDLMITGGEPTIKRDLIEILELAQNMGFEEITIQSNGSNLYRKEFVEKLTKFKNLKFNISFHASDPAIFTKLSKAPHTYKNTLEGLKNLGRYGISVFLTIVIQTDNYKHLKSHVQFVRNHYPFITHFSFNFIDPIYNAKENIWTVPTFSEAMPYMHETFSYILGQECTFRIEKIPLCFLRRFEAYQSNLRRHLFDEIRTNSFFRVKGDYMPDDWYKEEGKSQQFYPPQCKECKLQSICPGVNQNYVEVHGTDEIRPVLDRDPQEILAIARNSKGKSTSFVNTISSNASADSIQILKKQIADDLALFDHAIKIKPNKNNIYDTYSFFLMHNVGLKDEQFIYDSWKKHTDAIRAGREKDLLGFYIHMPYCKTNCTFCVYPSKTMANDSQLDTYVDQVMEKMKIFAPLFKGLKFKTFYMGGGTPSVLSKEQLDTLFSNLFSLFDFEEEGERAIEFNPSTTTLEKLKILEKHKFNKFSIGVQSLSKRVLAIHKRVYQTEEMVRNALDAFKQCNLNFSNVDLILGLKGDTAQEFLYSFEKLCQMGPHNICIYPVKTNHKYIGENYSDFKEFETFYYPLFDGVTEKINEVAQKNGFYGAGDNDIKSYVKPIIFYNNSIRSKEPKYWYSHFSPEPYSLFCLGQYSHSRIVNQMDYRYVDKEKRDSMFLKNFSENRRDFAYDVDIISPRFERVKFIVRNFYKHRSIDRAEYLERYGNDITKDFPYAIEALKLIGVVSLSPEQLIFKDLDEKLYYQYLLFFVGRKHVLEKTGPVHQIKNLPMIA